MYQFDIDFNIIAEMNKYVLPLKEFTIADGAFEKHGISKEYLVANGLPMKEVGEEFIEFIEGCDMLSYNGNRFDVKILSKDFKAAGLELDLNRTFYDALALEAKLQPRTLDATYKKYTGKDLENAHNALYDVKATIEIFKHQLNAFADQDITLDEIMGFEESQIFDVDGMFKKEDDKIIFTKGKYKGVEFMEVASKDVGYIKWYMNNPDFDRHTKHILREYYANNRANN
jgi:DNA polymerase-3 subunit epsilon